MIDKFTGLEASEFYRNKGLKRVSVTLSDRTTEFLDAKRKESNAYKITKQGDVVEALVAAYMNNPQFAASVDKELRDLLDQKTILKAGRKTGWRKDKTEDSE